MRLLLTIYDFECRLFEKVNRHFEKKLLNLFFRNITHLGGATCYDCGSANSNSSIVG